MKYIAHRRFKGKALNGDVNIPALSELEDYEGILIWKDKAVCFDRSRNAHEFFARDDDGQGMHRGRLTQAIEKRLRLYDEQRKKDPDHDERWDRVWHDAVCKPYRKTEHADHWLWNHDFYNASIADLEYIARLVGAKEGK